MESQQRSKEQTAHTWRTPQCTPVALSESRPSSRDYQKNLEKTRNRNCLHHTHLLSLEVASSSSSVGSFSCSYGEFPTWSCANRFLWEAAASSLPAALLHPSCCLFSVSILFTSCSRSSSFLRSHLLELMLQFFFSTLIFRFSS